MNKEILDLAQNLSEEAEKNGIKAINSNLMNAKQDMCAGCVGSE